MKMYDLFCSACGESFKAKRPDKRYCCQPCAARAGRRRRLEQLDVTKDGRDCLGCGKHFDIKPPSTNRRYCSEDCARQAARVQRRMFMRRNPERIKTYNANRPFKGSVIGRLRRRHPDIPIACESCGENRILEVAHRPEFKRNGAWKIVANTQRHMFWILCPTCHKVLDKGISTPKELGLK